MPASSEFSWASAHYKAPVFQVYGTKRKATEDSMVTGSALDQNEKFVKRQCFGDAQSNQIVELAQNTQFSQGNTQQLSMNAEEMHINQQVFQTELPTKVHPQLQLVHQVHAQRSPSPRPSPLRPGFPTHPTHDVESVIQYNHTGQQQNTNPLHDDYSQICNTPDHIMDLNDEVYDLSPASRAAQMAMDSDFVPDHTQYGGRYADAMEQIISGPGDANNTPSMVKCFCRPSWEGYMSSKPYVSDYY